MTTHLRERLQSTLGGAYMLERELGGGGMSRVFVATETALGRRVVVKVLPPEMAAGLSSERFAREILLAARLQHPHVVPVLAAGSWDGVPFYTMPFVEGESLRAHLRRAGALSVPHALRVLRDVARALAYAHRQGVVHRDVKPDNVLLSDGSALVTDFGVAKALDDALDGCGGLEAEAFDGDVGESGGGLTSVGPVVGTPAYVAPEQAAGDASADYRVDVYAFGAMAYELLTGAPPFAGRSPRAMVTAHMVEAPRPVSERRPDVPPPLARLVMRCLEKQPARRPRSAEELLRALDSLAAPLGRRARRLLVRRAARWARSVLAATAVAAVGAASLASGNRAGAERRVRVVHSKQALARPGLGVWEAAVYARSGEATMVGLTAAALRAIVATMRSQH
jgi:eukaryotic-like serine/threonine-protein kinase